VSRLGKAALRATCVALLAAGPVLAAAYPASMRIPPRTVRPSGPPAALYSHRTHATFACHVCHPNAFPQAAAGFTHEEMRDGHFCGGCHDGRMAFAITGAACVRCHVPAR
jgi:c(7)-type cytochrome triheme protein